MNVLLTNDDGVYADGIRTLKATLSEQLPSSDELWVVAPERERSASGHAITLHKPLYATPVTLSADETDETPKVYAVNGNPADCTKLAVSAIMEEPPDLVISGINRGGNLGTDVLYSGTVSAAIESVLLGVPAFAVSVVAYDNVEYGVAAQLVAQLVNRFREKPLPADTLLNINVPPVEKSKIKGIKTAPLGMRRYKDVFVKREDPRGRSYYWLSGDIIGDADSDSDMGLISQNMVSVTPLRLNLTHEAQLQAVSEWLPVLSVSSG